MATASKRVIGLLYGCEDYLTDMEGFHGPEGRSLLAPRHLISMAARAAGIVPVDTPFVQVKDEAGFEKHITQGRELGFEGILVMTPRQIEIARRMYTPSDEEVKEARHIVTLASQASEDSRGIALAGNVFISPPTLKRAQKILRRLDAVNGFESFRERSRALGETTGRLKLVRKATATRAENEREQVLV
jgi:citrate lyase subunit beta/citryl-CoA lyase